MRSGVGLFARLGVPGPALGLTGGGRRPGSRSGSRSCVAALARHALSRGSLLLAGSGPARARGEALRRRSALRGTRARGGALLTRAALGRGGEALRRGGTGAGRAGRLRAGALPPLGRALAGSLLPRSAGASPGGGHPRDRVAGTLRAGTLRWALLLLGAPRREDAAPVEGALSLQTGLVGHSARLGEDVALLAYQLVVDRRIR